MTLACVYSLQDLERLLTWLCTEETHRFNNCVAVSLLCRTDPQGRVLDRLGVPVMTLQEITDRLGQVNSLQGKPKLLLVQTCVAGACPQVLKNRRFAPLKVVLFYKITWNLQVRLRPRQGVPHFPVKLATCLWPSTRSRITGL